jgi:biotin synthase
LTSLSTQHLDNLSRGLFNRDSLLAALELRGRDQQRLFALARACRAKAFPSGAVEVRSVIEVSNVCIQRCRFCTIPAAAAASAFLPNPDEILEQFSQIAERGRQVVMLQSGEVKASSFVIPLIESVTRIKALFPEVELILCLGTLHREDLARLRAAGADRYILKFEASRPSLYQQIKPTEDFPRRLECLNDLVDLGFDVGTGNITGLPGQSLSDLVDDLLFVYERGADLSMASTSLFIPGPGSDYEHEPMGELDTVLNFMALLRIGCPKLLIPTTSSLEHARAGGQLEGLRAGANTITVHDGTPEERRALFPIYSRSRYTPQEARLFQIVRDAGLKLPVPLDSPRVTASGSARSAD